MKKAGRDVDVVSRHSGVVRSLTGDSVIRKLPSFRAIAWEVHTGDFCPITIDCFTRPCCVQLVHESEEQADKDFEKIHELEVQGLIDYAIICPKPPPVGAVVVVDPFSTGAHLAALVLKCGFKLILVFSKQDTAVASRIVTGADDSSVVNNVGLRPTLLVQHNSNESDQNEALKDTIKSITSLQNNPILAVIPGAETGIELADRLASKIGTRCNSIEKSSIRQHKFLSAESVATAGMRVPRQLLALTEDQVRTFWRSIATSSSGDESARCVIKPAMSLGGDHVIVCENLDNALDAFRAIDSQINVLGQINRGALCMEYLDGPEFVVDTVSRDGVCKVSQLY